MSIVAEGQLVAVFVIASEMATHLDDSGEPASVAHILETHRPARFSLPLVRVQRVSEPDLSALAL